MILFLAQRALKNRLLTGILCVLSIALSVALFIGIERVRTGAREGFTNTISQTDLIVGARGGQLQLLLYSVFHMGNASNNIRFSSFERWDQHPMIAWTVPFSLGDSYRGHRVVGTNENFFTHYKFRGEQTVEFAQGRPFDGIFDVVVGHEVAQKFQLELGSKLTLAHGVSTQAILEHENTPFQVVGILRPTATPVDRALYISLYGMEAMHMGWESGMPDESRLANPETLKKEDIEIKQITSFLLGAKNRVQVLRLRSAISQDQAEPLMAIIPGLTLQELWQSLGHIENILMLVSFCVLIVGVFGILIALYTSLQERRKEMAILRSLGAGLKQISALLITEAILLVGLGSLLGVALLYLGLALMRPYLESQFSLYLPIQPLSSKEWWMLAIVWGAALVAGLIPALKASYQLLQDGLSS